MHLHLFSSVGDDPRHIVEASRPYLENKDDPTIAYLPFALLYQERWVEDVQRVFKPLARLEAANAELMTQEEIEGIIRRASLVFVPGGNTFLLNYRLHSSGVMPYLRKKIQAGLPYIGFSAGVILCGPTIITSKDMNMIGGTRFDSLDLLPFNFLVHYATDDHGRSVHDGWVSDYHFVHDNPVLLMCDDAYVKVEGKKTILARGEAWMLRKDSEKERLVEGKAIVP